MAVRPGLPTTNCSRRCIRPFNEAAVGALAPLDGLAVLDIGCGPGSLSQAVVEHGGVAVGIDISESMVDGARELVPGARFEVADAQVDDLVVFAPRPLTSRASIASPRGSG